MQRVAAAIIVQAELVFAGTSSAHGDHKQVLVLYSTRRDAQFSLVGETELPRILDAGLGQNLDDDARKMSCAPTRTTAPELRAQP